MSISPKTRKRLFGLLTLGVLLHLLAVGLVYTHKPESISTTPDPLDYRLAALQMLDHHQFSFADPEFQAPQLLRTPGYPALLAGTYVLDGRTGLLMIIIQSLLVVAMSYILFILLRRFDVSENIALFLTALYLFEPLQWLYTLHTMTETISSFIIIILIACAYSEKGIATISRSVIFGASLGVLLFIKPSATMWVPFLLLMLLFTKRDWTTRIRNITISAVLCLLVITPWLIRNESLTGHYVLSSSGPFNFILFAGTPETIPPAYWEVVTTAHYNGHSNQVWYAYTTNAYPMLLETQEKIIRTAQYPSLLWRQVARAPVVWFGFIVPNNQEAYGHEYSLLAELVFGPHQVVAKAINNADTVLWALLLLATGIGAVRLLYLPKTRYRYAPLFIVLLLTVGINFGEAWTRMLLPVYPAIFLATGVALTYFFERVKNKKQNTIASV